MARARSPLSESRGQLAAAPVRMLCPLFAVSGWIRVVDGSASRWDPSGGRRIHRRRDPWCAGKQLGGRVRAAAAVAGPASDHPWSRHGGDGELDALAPLCGLPAGWLCRTGRRVDLGPAGSPSVSGGLGRPATRAMRLRRCWRMGQPRARMASCRPVFVARGRRPGGGSTPGCHTPPLSLCCGDHDAR